jgi:hypothetical protein
MAVNFIHTCVASFINEPKEEIYNGYMTSLNGYECHDAKSIIETKQQQQQQQLEQQKKLNNRWSVKPT